VISGAATAAYRRWLARRRGKPTNSGKQTLITVRFASKSGEDIGVLVLAAAIARWQWLCRMAISGFGLARMTNTNGSCANSEMQFNCRE